ncbi:MAG: tetratricopeptide repeat protein [Candidatus Solibacter usitatus]|nr:tetratricopeptide repeat protein [Candidatus Solibacter usitatus]
MRATSWFCLCLLAQTPEELVRSGVEQFHKGRYLEARQTLEMALRQSPGHAHATTFLALSRAATGGCREAIADLAAQFSGPPGDLSRLAGIGLSQCYLAEGRFEEAYPVIRRLQALYPADAEVLYQAAKLHLKAWNEAVFQMYQKTPASYRVNQLSAEIFEIQGRYSEAVAEYRKAIAKNPAAVNLHYRLGRALLMESHEPEALSRARKEFEAELQINPNDAVAEYQVAQILLSEQNNREAATRLERAVKLSPEFAEALVALGKIRLEDKRLEEAIGLLERAVQLQPKNEAARYSLMLAYRNAGRAEDALLQKTELDKLQKPPQGEFTEFLKKLGEKAPQQPKL